jgi:hypothetical protein
MGGTRVASYAWIVGLFSAAIGGCATAPKDIQATYVSPSKYASYSCDQLRAEFGVLSQRLGAATNAQQGRRTADEITGALIGITPTMLSPNSSREVAISEMMGEAQAMTDRSMQINCVLVQIPPDSPKPKVMTPAGRPS